jgi:hypothetical protein
VPNIAACAAKPNVPIPRGNRQGTRRAPGRRGPELAPTLALDATVARWTGALGASPVWPGERLLSGALNDGQRFRWSGGVVGADVGQRGHCGLEAASVRVNVDTNVTSGELCRIRACTVLMSTPVATSRVP